MKIIDRIFNIMESKNIKNVELAEYLNINKSVVSSWKSRNNNPPAEMIVQISELLKVSPIFLLTGKNFTNELSERENKLIENFNKLNEDNKKYIETYTQIRLENQEQENKDTNEKLA